MTKLVSLLSILLCLTSCQRATIEYREVKGIHEKVTESELKQFLRIVDSLPDKKLPVLPAVLRPLPSWSSERTLPVNELVNEEKKLLDQSWDVEYLAGQLKRNRALERALNREGMTTEQFVGLTLALGSAVSRSKIREDQDLDDIVKKGRQIVTQLGKDDRTFAKLSRDASYTALRRAGWLTRMDRAKRLQEVPPENIALVKNHADALAKVLPPYFLENPLDAVTDLLEERGMPFEELPGSGVDSEITWSRDDAEIGFDEPEKVKKQNPGKPSPPARTASPKKTPLPKPKPATARQS